MLYVSVALSVSVAVNYFLGILPLHRRVAAEFPGKIPAASKFPAVCQRYVDWRQLASYAEDHVIHWVGLILPYVRTGTVSSDWRAAKLVM